MHTKPYIHKAIEKKPSDYHNYTANYIFMDGDINNTD